MMRAGSATQVTPRPRIGVHLRIATLRATLALVAVAEFAWSVFFYVAPAAALGALGRTVVDPVIARQYPLYLASAALAYALAATNPQRYLSIAWVCVTQRLVELVVAAIDWHVHAIAERGFVAVASIEIVAAGMLAFAALGQSAEGSDRVNDAREDRSLVRLLRAFGGLQVFWFLASTIFVQLGARLLSWKLQDPYTTQQQGIGLLVIGLVSLLAARDVARYRVFVWVPVASQLIGVANAFNEIHLGSIGWGVAATQWSIELSIVAAFAYFSRRVLQRTKARSSPRRGAADDRTARVPSSRR